MPKATLWGIHAGKTDDADSLFFERNVIAIGWSKMGDLSELSPTREAFKVHYAKIYDDAKKGSVSMNAGQLYRFVHEMKENDFIAYPSKQSRTIHIGRVAGPYKRDSSGDYETYPNQRKVEWKKELPRSFFTQGALYEIGSAVSLFTIKNYADEFLNALKDADAKSELVPVPVSEDATVADYGAEKVEESTIDFVLKKLTEQTKGHLFAEFVANLLQTMGYRTKVASPGPDGGVDILARRDELGFDPPIIKVQVKSGEGSVGDPVLSQLCGKVNSSEFGLCVTLSTFTKQAQQFASHKPNLRLIDGEALVRLVLEHYEQLDSKYKGIIPLKRVYVPEFVVSDE